MTTIREFYETARLKNEKHIVRELLEITIVPLAYYIVIVALVFLALFTFGGAEESSNITFASFFPAYVYAPMMFGYALGILSIVMRRFKINNSWALAFAINSFAFNPEFSPLHQVKQNRRIGFSIFIAVSISVLFGLFILFSVGADQQTVTKFFFPSEPVTQQVEESGKVILGVEPASSSETLIIIYGIGVLLNILWAWLCFKNNVNILVYWMGSIIFIGLLMAGFGVLYHKNRYGADEGSLIYTAFFWFKEWFLVFLFGTILIGIIDHEANNFFLEMVKRYPIDRIFLVTISLYALYIIIYWGIYLVLSRFFKEKEQVLGTT